jgi:hypothetical protein
MEESRKAAYRHLGLSAYPAIDAFSPEYRVGILYFGSARSVNRKFKLIREFARWLSVLSEANIDDFQGFDETAFWDRHSSLCAEFPGEGIEVFKELFEDSASHLEAFNKAKQEGTR